MARSPVMERGGIQLGGYGLLHPTVSNRQVAPSIKYVRIHRLNDSFIDRLHIDLRRVQIAVIQDALTNTDKIEVFRQVCGAAAP